VSTSRPTKQKIKVQLDDSTVKTEGKKKTIGASNRAFITVPHLPQDTRHLLSLLLGSLVGSQLPLCDLQGTFVLANLEKLSDTLLIGGKPSNLPDQAPHEVDPLG
jgi:hypothetical protein